MSWVTVLPWWVSISSYECKSGGWSRICSGSLLLKQAKKLTLSRGNCRKIGDLHKNHLLLFFCMVSSKAGFFCFRITQHGGKWGSAWCSAQSLWKNIRWVVALTPFTCSHSWIPSSSYFAYHRSGWLWQTLTSKSSQLSLSLLSQRWDPPEAHPWHWGWEGNTRWLRGWLLTQRSFCFFQRQVP